MLDRSLMDYLHTLAEESPSMPLLGGERGWYTAAQAFTLASAAGRALLSMGLEPGDHAALAADRCSETAIMLLALRAAGLVVVLTDPRQEIDDALAECDVSIPLRACIRHRDGAVFSVTLGSCERTLTLDHVSQETTLPAADPDAPAFVIFTSGTTGKSKAVVQSENNYISNLLGSSPLGDYRPDDIALGALPLAHVFGLVLLCGAPVLRYGLFFPQRTDPVSLLRCIETKKITRMNGVPSLYLSLAECSGGFDVHSLRVGYIGGGPITPAQFIGIEAALDMTLISVYGMSECISVTCSCWRDGQAERSAGVGRAYPMNEVRLLDHDGNEVPKGQEGEICVRSPMRMLGYYGAPMPAEDFFPTGDLGILDDDGVLHLTGRKKDIIIRNGVNLSARRIEDALLRLPEVSAAAVVGLPDERQGEIPYAMIVGRADVEALRALLHKNEWPVGILQAEALPLTASGKTDQQTIREVLRSWRSS